ncbi:hypothetical protein AGMMS49928_18380 [Spirochaetia bacterium]|nr:hypothetical protein AGMMS49928_18380 [Spirochaetia bacterium]
MKIHRKTAAAIGYKSEEGLPRLWALGQGREAERIIELARQAGIDIVEDPVLAGLLDAAGPGSGLKSGEYLPAWCWEAVANILAFVLSKENA